jgi:hypothetical protein
MRPRAARGTRRLAQAAAAAVLAAFSAAARAADLPGATLTVTRDAGTETCPDEAILAADLARRMEAVDSASAPLQLAAALTRDGTDYAATVTVSGRKEGVRTLRAPGPSCDALREVLVVTLLLVLDEDPATPQVAPEPPPEPPPEKPPEPPPPPPPPPAPAPAPAPRPAAEARDGSSFTLPPLSLGAGLELTHGIPDGWSALGKFEVASRLSRFDFGLAAILAPERDVSIAGGTVEVRAWGGRARGCYAVWELGDDLRLGGCATFAVLALKGEGSGFDVKGDSPLRPWWLAGAGVDAALRLTPWLDLGLSASALATLQPERFSVRGAEGRYQTDIVVGSAGLDLRLWLW